MFKRAQFVEAFRDPKTYILFLASIAAQIPNGVSSNFGTAIISSFGFTQLQVNLLDIPNSITQISSLLLSGFLAGRFKNSRAILMVRHCINPTDVSSLETSLASLPLRL